MIFALMLTASATIRVKPGVYYFNDFNDNNCEGLLQGPGSPVNPTNCTNGHLTHSVFIDTSLLDGTNFSAQTNDLYQNWTLYFDIDSQNVSSFLFRGGFDIGLYDESNDFLTGILIKNTTLNSPFVDGSVLVGSDANDWGTLTGSLGDQICYYDFHTPREYQMSLFWNKNGSIYFYVDGTLVCTGYSQDYESYTTNQIEFSLTPIGSTGNPPSLPMLFNDNRYFDNIYAGYIPAPDCTPNWQCSQYSDCITKPYNHKDCQSVVDTNNCGELNLQSLSAYEQACTTTGGGGGIVIQTTPVAKQTEVTTTSNPIEQFILNLRSWLLNLLGLKA